MYLEIDEGFDSHPKTVRLCRVMGDVNAGQYLIRIWAWACRSAQDGDLSGMEAADVESIAKYKAADGKLFASLTEKWSPKFGPWIDCDVDRLTLHGWDERQGAAIKRLEKHAARMRDARAKPRDSVVPSTCAAREAHVKASPVKSSQDKTRPETDPSARVASGTPPNDPGKPTARYVLDRFAAIRAETCPGTAVFWQASPKAADKVATWLADMALDAAPDIEPAIRLACASVRDGKPGWTDQALSDPAFLLGAILSRWSSLRECIHGCAPKVVDRSKSEAPRRSTPVREW